MQKLDPRKEALLETLVREYVKTAEPVGSLHFAKQAGLSVSSATVRNELAELEEAGYLIQPHTSAGRVPTELAYRYFIEHLAHRGPHKGTDPLSKQKRGLSPSVPPSSVGNELSDVFGARAGAITAAKALAAKTHECVFVSFGRDDVYVTGLANLFAKPEFIEREITMSLTAALDQLDEMVCGLESGEGARLLIGEENPLNNNCSTVYLAPTAGRRVGVLGLMRMDYEKVLNLLDSIKF
jgi:transcriptional regulator of heat shock response